MREHRYFICFFTALCVLSFKDLLNAQSLPASVVDAERPIRSSDGFSNPNGIAVFPGGTIYVADQGHSRVLQFSPSGTQTVVDFGALSPAITSPTGVAIDGSGNLYVADETTNRLIKLSARSTKALAIMASPILNRPTAVATDYNGNLAIVNAGNKTVVIRRYGGTPTLLNTGTTVLIDPVAVAFDTKGLLYVADQGNAATPPAIYRFPELGGTATNLTPPGYALKEIKGIGTDAHPNIYVLDGASQQLIEIPASGAPAFLIPQSSFDQPNGLALDNLGNLYISDIASGSGTVTELVYNNAANFGSLQVGSTSSPVTFNYELYTPTLIQATRGISGGDTTGGINSEYKRVSGGTCQLKTYTPSVSSSGLTLPATCTATLAFTPTYPGGRSGAMQLVTSGGNINQLTFGIGLGAQVSLLNAAITTKVPSSGVNAIAINNAATSIYYQGTGGIYRLYADSNAPTLVTPLTGVSIAVNGAGDLFLFNPPNIIKVPADGTPNSKIQVPGLFYPQAMAMDPNGAFYISDQGPGYSDALGFVLRVGPTGDIARIESIPGYWAEPTAVITDGLGNIYVEDGYLREVFIIPGLSGIFKQASETNLVIGGSYGADPSDLAVDTTGTLYFWDEFVDGNLTGLEYSPPTNQAGPWTNNLSAGEVQMPLYTWPIQTDPYGYGFVIPFIPVGGNQTIAISPNNKMYVANGNGHGGIFVVNRSQGGIPAQIFTDTGYNAFQNPPDFAGPTQPVLVYNTGNQDLTFPGTQSFTESGNGVGSFSFSYPSDTPCQPGAVVVPGDYCTINVTNTNSSKNPVVADTLHFLTNAVNNNSVSFKINGYANPTP